jgi:hypothetical protein
MLSVRKNVVAVREPAVYQRAIGCPVRFIHHGLGNAGSMRPVIASPGTRAQGRSLIPSDRMEILAAPDDDAAMADAIIAEFLRRGSRHLPHELVAHLRGFTIAWVRDAQRVMRRQRQRAGASSTAASARTMLAHTEPAVD